MIIISRVIATNGKNQTVDIVKEAEYTQWLTKSQNQYDTPTIIQDVPYGTSFTYDSSLPYIWGFYNSKNVNLDGSFWTAKNDYGTEFHFGKHSNPSYLEQIHEKYYKDKGSNPKAATGGISFRPPEGSLALYDSDNNIILSFLSLAGATAKERSQYLPPFTSGASDAFHRAFNEPFEIDGDEKILKKIIRGSHDTIGYKTNLDDAVVQNRAIDNLSSDDFARNTYPVVSENIIWQQINLAHVEDLNKHYTRFKQNEFKRISDIYNLALNDTPNRSKINIDENNSQGSPLFSNGSIYNPSTNTLSIDKLSLLNPYIYENLVEEKPSDTRFAYEDLVHIVPESGIKHFRDGKIVLYSDTFESFAELSKPLNYDEFFNESSSFYNKTSYSSGKKEYESFIDNYYKYLSASDDVDDNHIFSWDRFKLKELELEDEKRSISSFDERGTYLIIDPSYVELSSDSKKGGWFLQKTAKTYEITREYIKSFVFAPFEVFNKLIFGNHNASSLVTHNFDHNLENEYNWEVFSDHRIKEGTSSLEAPLVSVKSYREYHRSLKSIVLESKNSGANDHYAGIYIGSMSQAGPSFQTSTAPSDGGCVLISAGQPVAGGNLASAKTWPESNQGGRIILDAHEIVLNTNRLMLGQIRLDQREKLANLNLGSVLLSLVPIEGAAISKIGDLLYNNHPINNKTSLKNFAP